MPLNKETKPNQYFIHSDVMHGISVGEIEFGVERWFYSGGLKTAGVFNFDVSMSLIVG